MLDKPEPGLDEWVDTLGKAKRGGNFCYRHWKAIKLVFHLAVVEAGKQR